MQTAVKYADTTERLRKIEDHALRRSFDRKASAAIDRLVARSEDLLDRLSRTAPTVKAEAR